MMKLIILLAIVYCLYIILNKIVFLSRSIKNANSKLENIDREFFNLKKQLNNKINFNDNSKNEEYKQDSDESIDVTNEISSKASTNKCNNVSKDVPIVFNVNNTDNLQKVNADSCMFSIDYTSSIEKQENKSDSSSINESLSSSFEENDVYSSNVKANNVLNSDTFDVTDEVDEDNKLDEDSHKSFVLSYSNDENDNLMIQQDNKINEENIELEKNDDVINENNDNDDVINENNDNNDVINKNYNNDDNKKVKEYIDCMNNNRLSRVRLDDIQQIASKYNINSKINNKNKTKKQLVSELISKI